MITANRMLFSTAFIAIMLIATTAWTLSVLIDAGSDVDRAVDETATMTALVDHIQAKRPPGVKNNFQGQSAAQVPQFLDDAMKSAGIDAESLARITPQPPRRLQDNNRSETRIQLVFTELSLRQALLLIGALTQGSSIFSVRDIHLTNIEEIATRASTTGWATEITVSYLTDVPPDDHRSAALAN